MEYHRFLGLTITAIEFPFNIGDDDNMEEDRSPSIS